MLINWIPMEMVKEMPATKMMITMVYQTQLTPAHWLKALQVQTTFLDSLHVI